MMLYSHVRRMAAGIPAALALLCLTGCFAHASDKKGIGESTHNTYWRTEVKEANVAWYYNWGPEKPVGLPAHVEFVPMAWGKVDPDSLHLPPHCKELLGTNEPDMKDQANMPVSVVAGYWPELVKTGLRIGSPATSYALNDWMKQFMQTAADQNLRVDFVCVHWYGGPNAQGFLDMLQKVHDTYNKPIWITEFGIADWQANADHPSPYTVEQVEDFMRTVLPELEHRDYIERYAWFPADPKSNVMGTSALFHEDGTLTDLGKLYASY